MTVARFQVPIATLILLSACTGDNSTPTEPAIDQLVPRAAGNVDTDPRALFQWDDQVNVAADTLPEQMAPAGITGDGRDKYGASATASEYQGNFCGVNGKIFWNDASASGTGDLVLDPDKDYNTRMKSCGGKRTLTFRLNYQAGGAPGAATSIGAFTNANDVIHLAVGQSRSQRLRYWYIGVRDCDRLDFDASFANTSNVRVTRLTDVAGARQWRVESEYPHMAMCTVSSGNQTVAKGTRYLPFGYTATEVPYPYPSYP